MGRSLLLQMVSPMKSSSLPRTSFRLNTAARPSPVLRAVCLSVALLAGTAAAIAASPADWAPGRLLVMQRAGLSASDLAKVLKPHGGTAKRIGNSDLHIVQLSAGMSETAVLALLAHHPQLRFAELDRRVAHSLVTNDPYLGSEWHLAKINAGAAWDLTQGSGMTIGICDTGVLPTHPDLKQVPGWNFVTNTSNTADVYGHGTAVAGAAAAMANNGVGVAGVAGAAQIMPFVVSDATGFAYFSTVASCVTYAADKGLRVVNASFASLYSSASVQSAGQYLKSKNGLLVVGAGNSGTNDGAPATTAMVTVSGTDSNDAMASWSSFGAYVNVAAPGVGIWTTSADGTYRSASGTSFSAPITAGVIALMMAANPSLSSSQVESLLYSTALDLGSAGRDIYYGYGRVNAAAAVSAAAAAVAVDTQAPSVAIASPLGGASVSGLVAVGVTASDNVGVSKVELRVNGSTVASDLVAPYQFSWDSATVVNGTASLVAVAFDAAGNTKSSTAVALNVANNVVADTTPPAVAISNPGNGSKVSGTVSVGVNASDNAGAAGIKQSLYLDGKMVASGTGTSLSYSWNTRKASAGSHTLTAVAVDASGNQASASVSVSK